MSNAPAPEDASRSRSVRIAGIEIGGGAPIALIAGPCVVESRSFMLEHARALKQIAGQAGRPLIFKSSFDKANRTRGASPRGPGLEEGLDVLAAVKSTLGLPILTDVHLPEQCAAAAEVADVLQIPAFLCRQTDLLAAAGRTGRVVNVKKGQFLAAEDMAFAVEKSAGAAGVLLTERGTSFGYRDLIVDFRNLSILRRYAPVVFDGTHSVQRPGAAGGTTGGDRREVPPLVRAAVAIGVDAVFLEVHPDPERAPSDGPNSLDYDGLIRVLEEMDAIERALGMRVRDRATDGGPRVGTSSKLFTQSSRTVFMAWAKAVNDRRAQHPIDEMLAEHHLMRVVLEAMELEASTIGNSQPVRSDFWNDAIDFVGNFGLLYHWRKKANHLYPVISELGANERIANLDVQQARDIDLTLELTSTVQDREYFKLPELVSIVAALKREKMRTEESDLLFPTRPLLSSKQSEALRSSFDEVEKGALPDRGRKDYLEVARRLATMTGLPDPVSP